MSAAAALILCMSPTVHDGDTLRCGSVKIRIANIEAPELPGTPNVIRAADTWAGAIMISAMPQGTRL